MVNFLILALVGILVGSAAGYIMKSKKRGIQCIGCPDAPSCGGNCTGCSGCGHRNS